LGDVSNYEITFDGKKMLVKDRKEYAMIDLRRTRLVKGRKGWARITKLKLAGLDMKLDRHASGPRSTTSAGAMARLFLRAEHERRRWKAMRDKVCRIGSLCEASQRSHRILRSANSSAS